jgi:hypothetical protein
MFCFCQFSYNAAGLELPLSSKGRLSPRLILMRRLSGWPDEFVKKTAPIAAQPHFVTINVQPLQMKKVAKNVRYFCNFQKSVQGKQSPIGLKFPPSGHPAFYWQVGFNWIFHGRCWRANELLINIGFLSNAKAAFQSCSFQFFGSGGPPDYANSMKMFLLPSDFQSFRSTALPLDKTIVVLVALWTDWAKFHPSANYFHNFFQKQSS